MPSNHIAILLVLLFLNACSSTDHAIRFEGIENGLARFELENKTSVDIAELDVELTYLAGNGSVILVDTVTYDARKTDGTADVFLRAKLTTSIVQKVPEGTSKAKARVLSVRP
jgi:hypothetical protein